VKKETLAHFCVALAVVLYGVRTGCTWSPGLANGHSSLRNVAPLMLKSGKRSCEVWNFVNFTITLNFINF